jgi:ubiquinone biosynthesis protein
MLWQALVAARDLGRLQEIASVLIRYGFGDVVRRMGLANALEKTGRALHWRDPDEMAHLPPPARMRRVMEELGPTFVKLGQVLATRVDLFEPDWIAEFSKLQSEAPPAPEEEVRAQLIEDLGAPPEAVFDSFDPVPIAAASIAQTYRARLQDGCEVVVKVRRPGIRPIVEADLRWLAKLAELAESESAELRRFRPRAVVHQFAHSLRQELDLASECRNAERIAANFAGYLDDDAPPPVPADNAAHWDAEAGIGASWPEPGAAGPRPPENARPELGQAAAAQVDAGIAAGIAPVGQATGAPDQAAIPPAIAAQLPPPPPPLILIPRIHWQWVSERLCVQDFVDAIPATDLKAVDAAGYDRAVLARRGARAVLKMVIEDGFFHADPHQGNVFYLPGNRIALIDFGMVGRLTEGRRDQLASALIGLVRDEPRRVLDVLLDWAGDCTVNEEDLILDIQRFADQYRGAPLGRLDLTALLGDLVAILRRHELALPSDLALLVKTFITLEGLGRKLDPNFNMAATALPKLDEVLRKRYTAPAILGRGWRALTEMGGILAALPNDFSRLLRAARRGRMEIKIEVASLKRVGNQIDRAANRMSIGLIVAALIIGSSIVMTVPRGPMLFGLPMFGVLGFIGAIVGGLWLVVSIWRTRHDE